MKFGGTDTSLGVLCDSRRPAPRTVGITNNLSPVPLHPCVLLRSSAFRSTAPLSAETRRLIPHAVKSLARLPWSSKSRTLFLNPRGKAIAFGVNQFKGTPIFPLSWGRGRFRRPRRKSVRGLPGNQARITQRSLPVETFAKGPSSPGPWPLVLLLPLETSAKPRLDLESAAALSASPSGDLCTTPLPLESAVALSRTWGKASAFGVYLFKRTPLFTLSKGRGRFRRPRRKSVRGLPRNQLRVTQRSPLGEGWGEGLPGNHSWGYVRVLPRGAPLFTLSKGRGRACPGLDPGFGRLRPKPVRGLPCNHLRVTKKPPPRECQRKRLCRVRRKAINSSTGHTR